MTGCLLLDGNGLDGTGWRRNAVYGVGPAPAAGYPYRDQLETGTYLASLVVITLKLKVILV
jgi:hypothetical protein